MARTVFMHVGVAKTGTTYLQRTLRANRDVLRGSGLLYPGRKSGDQFLASIDLRALEAEKFDHLDVDGMWDKIAAEVRGYPGNAVISHETFARCSSRDVRKVQESFPSAQLRIVLTARDLGRQIPAVWQETVKNRSTLGYDEFLSDIFLDADSGAGKFFWRPQDLSKVVRRWGRLVGFSNITVVTVPGADAPRDELWRRFAAAIELPDVVIDPPRTTGNVSLGPAEAELLRQVNAVLPEELPWSRYSRVVKRQFAERMLAPREGGRITVPQQWHQAVNDRASEMVDYLSGSGCRVIGDLADLKPVLPAAAVPGPVDLSRDQLLQVAAEVIRDHVILRPSRRRARRPMTTAATWSARMRTAAEHVGRRVRRGS
jgi:hypothetical protein